MIIRIPQSSQTFRYFYLTRRTISIGRAPSRDIQLLDPKVSRRQAIIRHQDGKYFITPCRNSRALVLNTNSVDCDREIVEGDILVLGDTQLFFERCVSARGINLLDCRKIAGLRQVIADTLHY